MTRLLLIALSFLGAASVALAQDRGTMVGTVTDAVGAAVPQAKIEIVQLDTNAKWSLDTNEVGQYYSPNMPLGQYRVSVQKAGFSTATTDAVQVT